MFVFQGFWTLCSLWFVWLDKAVVGIASLEREQLRLRALLTCVSNRDLIVVRQGIFCWQYFQKSWIFSENFLEKLNVCVCVFYFILSQQCILYFQCWGDRVYELYECLAQWSSMAKLVQTKQNLPQCDIQNVHFFVVVITQNPWPWLLCKALLWAANGEWTRGCFPGHGILWCRLTPLTVTGVTFANFFRMFASLTLNLSIQCFFSPQPEVDIEDCFFRHWTSPLFLQPKVGTGECSLRRPANESESQPNSKRTTQPVKN